MQLRERLLVAVDLICTSHAPCAHPVLTICSPYAQGFVNLRTLQKQNQDMSSLRLELEGDGGPVGSLTVSLIAMEVLGMSLASAGAGHALNQLN